MKDRNRKLGLIHIAKKQCKLSDDDYRSLLLGSAGVDSASLIINDIQYDKVMSAFKKIGFRVSLKKHKKIDDAQLAKCYAMWCELYKLGAVRTKNYSSMVSWMNRQLGVQDIYTGWQKSFVIEELKNWIERVKEKEK